MVAKKYHTEEERKTAARAANRRWYASHREAARAYNAANKAKQSEAAKVYYAENRDARLQYHRTWREDTRTSVQHTLAARVSQARKQAKKKGLPFNLTKAYLVALYDAHPLCAITNLPFDLTTKYATISLDRIVPSAGYTIGNVRLVWWLINAALGNWGEAPLCIAAAAITSQSKHQT